MRTITQNFKKIAAVLLVAASLTSSFVVKATELTFTTWTSGSPNINADYMAMTQPDKDAVTKITFVSSTITLGNNEIYTIATTTNFPNLEVVDLSGVQATSTTFPKAWGTGTTEAVTANTSKLKSINLPTNVTSIFQNAFSNCAYLETVVFPAGLTTISSYAFCNCSKLVNINIQNTLLNNASNFVFSKCTALMEVILPNTLAAIGTNMFRDCSSLETLTLPAVSAITSGGNTNMFVGCPLKKVICRATTVPTTASQLFTSATVINTKLYVPTNLVQAYKDISATDNPSWYRFTDANILSIDDLTTVMGVTSESKSVVVYPNPVKSSFSIKNHDNIASVEIVSLAGQLLKSFNQKQLSYSVSGLNKGCYFVRINSKSNPQTVKIVVE